MKINPSTLKTVKEIGSVGGKEAASKIVGAVLFGGATFLYRHIKENYEFVIVDNPKSKKKTDIWEDVTDSLD